MTVRKDSKNAISKPLGVAKVFCSKLKRTKYKTVVARLSLLKNLFKMYIKIAI